MEDFGPMLGAARNGDGAARERLLRSLLPDLRAYVRLRTGPLVRAHESTSDLVQSVCAEVLAGLGEFRGDTEGSFRQWLYTAALRKVIDRQRFLTAERRDARALVEDGDGALRRCYASICSPSRAAIAREEIARFEAAFDELPDEHREILALICLAGLSHREAAERLGRSEEATRKLLSRARARLAALLARDSD
jgi:RNA polymerase sigma-70 factor (ECF subfamily)